MLDQGHGAAPPRSAGPLADPVIESRRLVEGAATAGLTIRVLGGVAVRMQAPSDAPLPQRSIGDIDIATRQGGWRALAEFLKSAGYAADDMFNALNGARRLLFFDHLNDRKLDVFVGEFDMCHSIPVTGRLEKSPMTVPLAELLLTKLQIVQLTERDLRDIYSLTYHHNVSAGDGSGIEADFIANLCAKDWGLWRTCTSTIQQSLARLPEYPMPADAARLVAERLKELSRVLEKAPKSARWKLRSRVGDKVRWYNEPEENLPTPTE
ncbi:MAG: hypothetical protein M3082_18555 [Candidatus Dormibacteraeota bacterium]|nr:hypothetical protein [Candidatus Dormibacteraeota bacterium]